MEDICHIDMETFSECELKKVGMYRYFEDDSTEILCLAYAFGSSKARLWACTEETPELLAAIKTFPELTDVIFSRQCPDDLRDWILAGKKLGAHNAPFERTGLGANAGQRLGVPRTQIGQWRCTAAKSVAMGLQRALGDVAKALGTYPKDDNGKAGMLRLSKPRKVSKAHPEGRYTPANSPIEFAGLYAYCVDDVYAERDIDKKLPHLSAREQKTWELDQRMNDRGVAIDVESVHNVIALIEEYKAEVEKEFIALTGVRPNQTAECAKWVRDNGYDIPNLQAATVLEAVQDPTIPAKVKRALILRSIYASKAVAKYPAMLRAVMKDRRIRGMFMYYGAHTGRWSSTIVQLQNLFRGAIDDPTTAIEAYRCRDLDYLKALYNIGPMKVFASTVRGMLVPDKGKRFIDIDFAGIESRVIAWLCGEKWKLEAFYRQDKEGGPDNYQLAYSNVFQVPVTSITKAQRQIGKPIDLGLGFEGGVGAFVTMAKTYNVSLDMLTEAAWGKLPEIYMYKAEQSLERGYLSHHKLPVKTLLVCEAIKHAWRAKHPKIVQGWRDAKDCAVAAIESPGKVFCTPNRKLMFKKEDRFLHMRLPSGRRLRYFEPKLSDTNELTYIGLGTKSRRWGRTGTYGGAIVQHATQGTAYDLITNGMHCLEDEDYPVVGTVHDEGLMEVALDYGSVEEATQIICRVEKWAAGLPIAAEGWTAGRFKK